MIEFIACRPTPQEMWKDVPSDRSNMISDWNLGIQKEQRTQKTGKNLQVIYMIINLYPEYTKNTQNTIKRKHTTQFKK